LTSCKKQQLPQKPKNYFDIFLQIALKKYLIAEKLQLRFLQYAPKLIFFVT